MYKYRFHYLLRKLSYDDYEIAMKFMPLRLKMTKQTWRNWIYLKQDSKKELKYSKLRIIAKFFNCRVKDLFEKEVIQLELDFNIKEQVHDDNIIDLKFNFPKTKVKPKVKSVKPKVKSVKPKVKTGESKTKTNEIK